MEVVRTVNDRQEPTPAAIEKLACEAELIGTSAVSSVKIIMWAEDNGVQIAALLRRLLPESAR